MADVRGLRFIGLAFAFITVAIVAMAAISVSLHAEGTATSLHTDIG